MHQPLIDGVEADDERAAALVREHGVLPQRGALRRGSADSIEGLEPPRIDQLLAADLRVAKLAQGPFLVLFWASKKEPPPAKGMERIRSGTLPTVALTAKQPLKKQTVKGNIQGLKTEGQLPFDTPAGVWEIAAMFNITQIISEELIQRAIKEGKLDNLDGMGKPLKPDEAADLPAELRMAYRVLKTSGYIPEDIVEEREIVRTIDLLEHMDDERERYRQIQKLNVMIMKMNERRGRPVNLDGSDEYYQRIVEKVRIAEERSNTTKQHDNNE